MRRRLWTLVAGPLMISQCAPTQCAPEPAPAPAPPPVEAEPPPTAPPAPTPTEQPVAPPPAPIPAAWSFLSSNAAGQYTRWNPCADPIRYQVDVTVVPTADERAAIAAAVATASATSGHTFELVGDGTAQLLPGSEAVIGLRDFGPGTLGQGGGRFASSLEMVSGSAYIDTALAPAILRSTLLHEIGHLLGLGHVDDAAQLMYPVIRTPPMQDYQWGDREGMRLVGTTQPCTMSLLNRADAPTREVLLD